VKTLTKHLERGVYAASPRGGGAAFRLFGVAPASAAKRRKRRAPGFSLIEIMVTVGLMSFIILGLLTMFSQTQRAFRTSMTLTDVLENGRATSDMLVREIEQMTPSQLPYITNGAGVTYSINFRVWISAPDWNKPLFQALPGSGAPRVNIVQNFFFLTKQNQDWTGIGYAVLPPYAGAGIGTLYRFSNTKGLRGPSVASLSVNFQTALNNALLNAKAGLAPTNYGGFSINRIADGIVHLRVLAFATNGFLITTNGGFLSAPLPAGQYVRAVNIGGVPDTWWPSEVDYSFSSNAVPASVELELGMLEPQVYERYRSLAAAPTIAQLQFLSNHTAQVHLFRQRIPIRNIDFAAYR
jgi:type II secretory pathway pseudopilin PulG